VNRKCIDQAVHWIHKIQTPQGGWVGSWGICFTYAAQFALESLALVGETYETSEYSKKGCDFLISRQRSDGGWGESYKVSLTCSRFWYVYPICCLCRDFFFFWSPCQSCEVSQWIEHAETQVVQTCWATMGLMYAHYPHPEPIENAVRLVMSRQLPV
jgi:lanosterol synthase